MSLSVAQENAATTIYNTALAEGIPPLLATLMVGQSGNETNGWTSNFFVNNNNGFGFSCKPSSEFQNGCSNGMADNGVSVGNYDSLADSTREVVQWIFDRQDAGVFPEDLSTITSADQYAQLLKNGGYYEASVNSYTSNIQRWIANLGSAFIQQLQSSSGLNIAIVLIIGLAIYFTIKKGFFKIIKL